MIVNYDYKWDTGVIGKRLVRILLCLVICMMLVNQSPTEVYATPIGVGTSHNLDMCIESGEMARYIDESFETGMKKYNIPGAVISIVKDGKVVVSKGYGYADLKNKVPVVPEKTLFRIASVTKLFTANAVMQLVDTGEIKLDEDVGKYLKHVKIPNPYPQKVTMNQLLTHTSGIDSDIIGDLSEKESEAKSISDFLQNRMLPVVREPGQFIQYSNYGPALAGCIVENISGETCAAYIGRNILNPLEMRHSSFKMTDPELAKGYVAVDGKAEERELTGYFNLYPVGGLVSTADDMAKFIQAHLNNGEYGGKRILSEGAIHAMHQRHAGFDARVPGTCYGFYENIRSGQRTIGHSGYSPDGFLTELCLIEDHNMGIFVSVNQGSNNSFPQEFVDDFIGRYLAVEVSKGVEKSYDDPVDQGIAGTYRFGEYTRSTLNKGNIFGAGADVKVSINKDGSLTLNETDSSDGKKSISTAIQVDPLVFKKEDGEYVVFKRDGTGRVSYMAQTSNSWHGTYERIDWYDENAFQIGLFSVCSIIFLLEMVFCLRYSLWRFFVRQEDKVPRLKIVSSLSWLMGVNAVLNILFFGISMMTWGERLRYGMPWDAKLLLIIPMISTLISVALTAGAMAVWRKKAGSMVFRIHVMVVAMASILYVWIYHYWNFLGFRY